MSCHPSSWRFAIERWLRAEPLVLGNHGIHEFEQPFEVSGCGRPHGPSSLLYHERMMLDPASVLQRIAPRAASTGRR
jgi:hypothetical protein